MTSSEKEDGVSYVHRDSDTATGTGTEKHTGLHAAAERGQAATDQ